MREYGFYWVKFKEGPPVVAEWGLDYMKRRVWFFTGVDDSPVDERLIQVVSERLLPPDWDQGPPLKSEG